MEFNKNFSVEVLEGEVAMHWGQFLTRKARGEYDCRREGCTEKIGYGDNYFGLFIHGRGNTKGGVTLKFHQDCFLAHIESATERRTDILNQGRSERASVIRIDIPPEKKKRRVELQKLVSDTNKRLVDAYRDKSMKKALSAKRSLVRYLTELATGNIGPPYEFKFSEELTEYIRQGVDPTLVTTTGNAIELLANETPVERKVVVIERTSEQQAQDNAAARAQAWKDYDKGLTDVPPL